MEKLQFKTEISAPASKVWDVLWKDKTYREWTRVFGEGGFAKSDWKEGSRILFMSESGEGMYSRIDKLVPEKIMSFEHLGVLKDGKEQPHDEKSKEWSGSKETYTLSENEGKTRLEVEMDVTPEFADFFKKTFPQGLDLVKKLAESNGSSSGG